MVMARCVLGLTQGQWWLSLGSEYTRDRQLKGASGTMYFTCIAAIHYSDVIMGVMASQTTSVSIVYSIVCSGADQRKHLSSASLAFVRGISPVTGEFPHKGPVTRKCFLWMTSSCIWLDVNEVSLRNSGTTSLTKPHSYTTNHEPCV